jgi:hypothetical protein
MTVTSNNVVKQSQNDDYPYATLGGGGFDIRQIIYEYTLLVLRPVTLTTSTETEVKCRDCFILDFQNINCAHFRVNKQISRESLYHFYKKNNFEHIIADTSAIPSMGNNKLKRVRWLLPFQMCYRSTMDSLGVGFRFLLSNNEIRSRSMYPKWSQQNYKLERLPS